MLEKKERLKLWGKLEEEFDSWEEVANFDHFSDYLTV